MPAIGSTDDATHYDMIGRGYAAARRPDPRIAAQIDAALGDCRSVVNVGAGTGSYEPTGRNVIAVEPSTVMIRQRPGTAAPCVRARAEALPFPDQTVDAAMAVLTIHHWSDQARGLAELKRIARRRVVVLTWALDAAPFWLTDDYLPEFIDDDRTRFLNEPDSMALFRTIFDKVSMVPISVPHDCTDGFLGAYWRRPEAYLAREVQAGISSFARIDASAGLARLARDLSDGTWHRRYGVILQHDHADIGYRLFCCEM